MDESQLVVKAREGDESAFSLLAKRYGNFVLALSSYYVGAGDSHDAAQEIWLAVYSKLWQLEDPQRFIPWLKKLVFYQCLNYRKARRRRIMYEIHMGYKDWQALIQATASSEMPFDEALELDEAKHFVSHHLDMLPAEYGMILRLYYFKELSLKQISELTQLPVSTVKGRLYQGRQILKGRLLMAISRKGHLKWPK